MKKLLLVTLLVLVITVSGCVTTSTTGGSNSYSPTEANSYSHVKELDRNYHEPVKHTPEMKHEMLLTYEEIPYDSELEITSIKTIDPSSDDAELNSDYLPGEYSFEENLLQYSEGITQASYEDQVYVTISSTSTDSKDVVDELVDSLKDYYIDGEVTTVRLSGGGKVYEGYKITTSEDITYLVAKEGEDIAIVVYASADNALDAKRIVRELGSGLPENIKKEIWTLPENPPFGCRLISVETDKLTDEYAAEKDYAEWAQRMVGHYDTSATYDCGDYEISVGFFDLNTIDLAREVYSIYSSERENDTNAEKITVKGYPGWYIPVDWLDWDEINFRVGYFLVAVDGIPSVGRDKLIEFAERLQI